MTCISQIKAIEGNIEGLKEGIALGPGGKLSVDDPGATKLLLEQQNLQALVGQYRNLLGEATLDRIQKLFDKYICAVLTRNNAVMQYNASVTMLTQAKETIASQERQLSLLGRIANAMHSTRVRVPTFVARTSKHLPESAVRLAELLLQLVMLRAVFLV